MKTDIGGKLRNADVPKGRPLLPVFEALVNSFQSIESTQRSDGRIEIEIVRVPILVEGVESEIQRIIVRDNGAGFDDENFRHFSTAETLNKVSVGGKGIGRFTWLNVFDNAEIQSYIRVAGKPSRRSFKFSVHDDPEETVETIQVPESEYTGLTEVKLSFVKDAFCEHFPKDADSIAQQVVEHCFLLIIKNGSPSVLLRDGELVIDLVAYCNDYALDRAFRKQFEIDQEIFEFIGIRKLSSEQGARRDHKLHFTAHGRPVITIHLKNCIPNLKGHTVDEANTPFAYTAFVTGTCLDRSVNQNRTDFSLHKTVTEKQLQESLFPQPSLEEIRVEAIELLQEDLRPVLDRLNSKKQERLERVAAKHPEYQHLLKNKGSFIDRIPPGSGDAEIERVLSEELHKRKVRMRDETRKTLRQFNKASMEEQEKTVQKLMEQITDLEKSALAEYVAHRRVIIEFLDRSLGIDPDTGKHRLEKVLHSIVFPMRTTSQDVMLDNQNLWLVDERLSYHVYLASDKSLRSMDPISSDDLTRPDLLIINQEGELPQDSNDGNLFDRFHILSETQSYPLTSFVIIEFKRPNHTDYSNDNPIDQVYDQIMKIRAAKFKDRRGRYIQLHPGSVPAFAFIICDLTNEVRLAARKAQLKPTPDGQGFFGFHADGDINAYIEVVSYDKLIEDAKRRNLAFFDKLGFPVTYRD